MKFKVHKKKRTQRIIIRNCAGKFSYSKVNYKHFSEVMVNVNKIS